MGMRRKRLKKWPTRGKWVCTLAAGLVAALAAFSACWGIYYYAFSADGEVVVNFSVESGLVYWYRQSDFGYLEYAGRSGVRLDATREWHWGLPDEVHVATDWRAGLEYTWSPTQHILGVSLGYPILLFSTSAALLWYADRRRFGPHQCSRCGYDRGGLAADAKCPECGTASTM